MGALAVQKIDFHGDELDVIRDGERLWISVRRVCDALGLDPDGQRRKLQAKPWACTVIISAHDSSGRAQPLFCIDLKSLPMWLATIDLARCAADVQPKLTLFQLEAHDVLAAHVFGGPQPVRQPDRLATLQWAYGELKDLGVLSPEAKGALVVRIAGEQGIDLSAFAPRLPDSHARTWTATEIAEEEGCKPAHVGRAVSKAGIRGNPDYCITVLTTTTGPKEKQVPQYRYSAEGRRLIVEALRAREVAP